MKAIKFALAAVAACVLAAAHAAGPLLTTDKPNAPQPLRWDTSKGKIPVYTSGEVLTYKYKSHTPVYYDDVDANGNPVKTFAGYYEDDTSDGAVFLSDKDADKITANALKQWSDVPTSTWKAETNPAKFTKFAKVPTIGAGELNGDPTSPNYVGKIYEQFNGGGIYVIYDTHGRVLEEYFGVPRDQVLGIAFAEVAEDRDGDGYPETIVEATAVMNGYIVAHETPVAEDLYSPPADIGGKRINGVFTHEFGHAINLSHAQVNGQLAYFSRPYGGRDLYPGVPGCVPAQYHWGHVGDPYYPNSIDPKNIETMFPFIDTFNIRSGQSAGQEQASIDRADDIAAISNLYPTAAYAKTTGSIAGTLYLKDGRTPYSGINVIARNVKDPLGDAVSAMTGDQTQGKAGPDGRFRINNLKPGQTYQLYLEEIYAGGYPTEPMALVSQAEYWNTNEQSSPAKDTACMVTGIKAEAGVTKTANFYFNGYQDGVQYTPLTAGYLTSLSKNGGRAGGVYAGIAFLWDAKLGIVQPDAKFNVQANNGAITRDGRQMLVQADLNGNVLGTDWDGSPLKSNSMALWDINRGSVTDLGSLNGDTCGGSSSLNGVSSSYGWALDARGKTAVGSGYIDRYKTGSCESFGYVDANGNYQVRGGDIVPFIWTEKKGPHQLSLEGVDLSQEPWHRAQAVSGDGSVVLGNSNFSKAYAWINEGKPIDLFKLVGAYDAYAINTDGSRVALMTGTNSMLLWNATKGTGPKAFTKVPDLKWCQDMPLVTWWGGDECANLGGTDAVYAAYGPIAVQSTDMSDDGSVIIGRAGDFNVGFAGVMWLEKLGWVKLSDFFRTQGVVEAERYGMDNPLAISGRGSEIVGGIPGVSFTWYIDMKTAFVCKHGRSEKAEFPEEFIEEVRHGARMGRCEHLK